MTLKFKQSKDQANWALPGEEEELAELPTPRGRLRPLLNRAVSLYVGLFFGLSLLLSLLGVDPLIHNGLMPKALLVYVGAALLLAWAGSEVQQLDEPSSGWFVWLGRWRL